MLPAANILIAADNFLRAMAIDSEVHMPVLCNLEVITQLQMACTFFSCLKAKVLTVKLLLNFGH